MNIAFFDSGIGGLTVLKETIKLLPNEKYIYYADKDNIPYGIKTKSEIKKYVFNAVKFLIQKNIKMLVLACNTATTAAIDDLRKVYKFPIIGMEPAIKPASQMSKKRILVLATTFTLRSSRFVQLIKKTSMYDKIDPLALDKLVLYAENFDFNSDLVVNYITASLNKINIQSYDVIVLGCTHFIFYKDIIKSIVPQNVSIIDGNIGTAYNVVKKLKENNLLNKSNNINNNDNNNIIFYKSNVLCNKEISDRMYHILNNVL